MSFQKIIILFFLSIFLLALTVIQVNACSCMGPRQTKNFHPCGIFWNSDVIFIGLAEKVSDVQTVINGKPRYLKTVVQFSVEKAVRGVEGKTVEVETGPSGGACGYSFKQGERYFVYLRRGQDGRLSEWLCGPTVLLKNAAADLEFLRAVENGEKGGRVYGNVSQIVRKSFSIPDEYIPLEGVKIILTSIEVKDYTGRKAPKYEKRKFQTTTDDKGFYLFQGVPAGMYKVKTEFPNNLRDLSANEGSAEPYVWIDEDKRRCASSNFGATLQSSLEGRIVDRKGQNPPQQFVSLLPVDENGKIDASALGMGIWVNRENGRFYFNLVPPGKYLLAINPGNCPRPRNSEFGKMFFPGVASESEAEIISIAENERKKISDFRLLPPLKERIFSGVVLSADKIPLSNAKVFMIDQDGNKCGNLSSLGETKTDEFGRFQIKGYESYEYKIRAFVEKPARLHSELIDIPASGNFENLELIVSKTY